MPQPLRTGAWGLLALSTVLLLLSCRQGLDRAGGKHLRRRARVPGPADDRGICRPGGA